MAARVIYLHCSPYTARRQCVLSVFGTSPWSHRHLPDVTSQWLPRGHDLARHLSLLHRPKTGGATCGTGKRRNGCSSCFHFQKQSCHGHGAPIKSLCFLFKPHNNNYYYYYHYLNNYYYRCPLTNTFPTEDRSTCTHFSAKMFTLL